MQVNTIGSFLIASLLALLLLGCSVPEEQVGVVQSKAALGTEPAQLGGYHGSSVARRFEDASPQSRTAVDSAVELLEKHAELSERTAKLDRQNRNLTVENDRLKERTTTLEAELKQAQKELAEANDLLVEMRIELNNWKANILGFRQEMREAETAQLEALLKILKILGGEVTVEAARGPSTEQPTAGNASRQGPEQAKAQETSVSGESNG